MIGRFFPFTWQLILLRWGFYSFEQMPLPRLSLSDTVSIGWGERERDAWLVVTATKALGHYSKVRLLPKTYFVTPELWYNFRDHEKSFSLLERPNTRLILAALCKYKWVTVGGTFQHLLFPPSSSSSSHSFFLSPEPFFCNALCQSGAGCSTLLAGSFRVEMDYGFLNLH